MDDSRIGASPDRGLLATLTASRSGKSSIVGISSSNASTGSNEPEHTGFMDKLKSGTDKLKIGRRGSVDERRKSGDTSTGRRLSKLLKSRGRNKKDDAAAAEEETLRGRMGQRDGESADTLGVQTTNGASGRTSDDRDSIASSLLTEESDPETSRPNLDTRPSHAGYLTLSSPLIAAETIDSTQETTPPATLQSTSNSGPLQAFPDSTEASISPTAALTSTRSDTESFPQTITSPTSPRIQTQPLVTPPAVGTPTTFITPPTPIIPSPTQASPALFGTRRPAGNSRLALGSIPAGPPSAAAVRRLKSASTASSGIVNPLTPAIEEAKTPGGSLTQPQASSFFSSVFSATQNAVNQLSSSIDKSLGTRSRSGTASDEKSGTSAPEGSSVLPGAAGSTTSSETTPPRQPAIATIGSGNLSLSHLGIPEVDGEASTDPVKDSPARSRGRASSILQDSYMPSKHEEVSAAHAVSAAYVEKPANGRAASIASEAPKKQRPMSLASVMGSTQDETTPPASIRNGDEGSSSFFKRSGSVRSRLSNGRRRRRESSNVTGTGSAITAALLASHSRAEVPAKDNRPAGFAVATAKRNQDFHALFRSVPDDDYLVEDYSAALHREILLQGRLYVSEKHVCFASNILGWVTNLVISFEEIVAIEKKNTALVIPNAIVIQTLNAKNVFASLIGRDPTYDLIISIWRLTHPNLKETEHGHSLDSNTTPSDENGGNGGSEEGSQDGSQSFYEDDDDENEIAIDADTVDIRSEAGDMAKAVSMRTPSGTQSVIVPPNGAVKVDSAPTAAAAADFPGPATHAPTECSDKSTHYDKMLLDTTIPAPLGKVYSMMFGAQSGVVMKRFFVVDQKSADVQIEDDKTGLDQDHKTFSYSYIKFLGASIGPKSTKCIVSQTLDAFDLESSVSVTCSTLTPDVPSGSAFTTKTRYCLMWGPGNSTRFVASCCVEWSAKSWLKGPIENGANVGQEKHCKDLVAFFKQQLSAKAPAKAAAIVKGKTKGRRKRSDTEDNGLAEVSSDGAAHARTQSNSNWGPLEPLHDILNPLMSMLDTTVMLGILCAVMSILWIRQAYFVPHAVDGRAVMMTPQRLAAYEEMWRREESGLWNWLEDRVGLDALGEDLTGSQKRHLLTSNSMAAKVESERMNDREVDEAIRVTEEKLAALKSAMERKKEKQEKKASKGRNV